MNTAFDYVVTILNGRMILNVVSRENAFCIKRMIECQLKVNQESKKFTLSRKL